MLVFSTKLYVNQNLTNDKFIEMAIRWVKGGTNYTFGDIVWDGSEEFSCENPQKTQKFTIMKYGDTVIVNLINNDKKVIWTNDYVLTEKDGKRVLAVFLYNDLVDISVKLPERFNRPRLLKQIVSENYGGVDNSLQIGETPLVINKDNIDLAYGIMKGEVEYFMPVVYISARFGDFKQKLDCRELAKDLAGVAHVWVEESCDCTRMMRDMTEGKNPYGGAVQIFYPNRVTQRILAESFKNKHEFRNEIATAVFRKLILSRIDGEFSWTKIRYNNLMKKSAESLELSEICDQLVEEAQTKVEAGNSRIQELEEKIASLQAKLQICEHRLKQKGNENNVIYLAVQELDLYEDEIKDIILRVIEKEISTMSNDPNQMETRKSHVLKSIQQCNLITGKSEDILKELREVLNGDGGLKGAKRRRLKDLGFEMDEGKHYKITYQGDPRYMITISKTSSDFREPQNLISQIKNKIF